MLIWMSSCLYDNLWLPHAAILRACSPVPYADQIVFSLPRSSVRGPTMSRQHVFVSGDAWTGFHYVFVNSESYPLAFPKHYLATQCR